MRRGAGYGARWPYIAALAAITLVFLVPQLWLLSLSLKEKSAVYQYPPRLIPENPTTDNYWFALTRTQIPWYLWNSFKVAFFSTVLTLTVSLPAAYALSRERFRARGPIMAGLLAMQMLSPVVLLVPIYGLIQGMGLVDTHTGLILVYGSLQVPFTIWLMKSFFDSLPPALFDAARVDGAGRWLTFRAIALPLVGPGLAAAAILNLASYWAEFSLALVLLDAQERFTIPVGLFSLQGAYETEWHIVAAASIVGLVPVIGAFVLLQRHFIAGLTAGSVKG
ncbi:MAG TPA: carbohydrate ABC transporter permease [Vicinamibacterales bacterium]|nr:carbohydrate ABC transporter permease [Vicinamibacterales bacterium]